MKYKILSIALVLAMLAAVPVGMVHAADNSTTVFGTGTIVSIMIKTDAGLSTVHVGLVDSSGNAQEVTISLETAISYNLIIPDATMIGTEVTVTDINTTTTVTGIINTLTFVTTAGVTTLTVNLTPDGGSPQDVVIDLEQGIALKLIVPNQAMIGTDIVIDPNLIIDSATFDKMISKLGTFFASIGVDFTTFQTYHDQGMGFGVLSQAAWITFLLGGDATTFDLILAAKTSGDFSTIILPDGSVAKNWGSLLKAVRTSGKQNMGQIISGHAGTTATSSATTTTHGNGNGNGNGNGHGH